MGARGSASTGKLSVRVRIKPGKIVNARGGARVASMMKIANLRSNASLRVIAKTLKRFDAKNGWIMSSHVAMSMMMALFPFLLFTVALAGTLSQDYVTNDLIDLVFGSWPEAVADPLVTELRRVLSNAGSGVMTLGGVLAVYFASNGVDAVRTAMSRAYHDTDTRPFWKTRLLAIGLVIAGGALLLVAAAVEVVLPLYFQLVSSVLPSEALAWVNSDWVTTSGLSWLFVTLFPAGAVLACHALLPARRHHVREVLPGVLLTLGLWAAAGLGFSFYIAKFASYSATYAGLAGAMSALIFLYLIAAILILGAEFNGVLMEERRQAEAEGES